MNTLPSNWQPSTETRRILSLNQIPDNHIDHAADYFVNKFANTDIKTIEQYDSWNAFFLMFAVKSYRQMNPDAYVPSIDDLQ